MKAALRALHVRPRPLRWTPPPPRSSSLSFLSACQRSGHRDERETRRETRSYHGEPQIRRALNRVWTEEAKEAFVWQEKCSQIEVVGLNDQVVDSVSDGSLNACENLIDRHLKARGDRVAIFWKSADDDPVVRRITYRDLHSLVCSTASYLQQELGLKQGDNVLLYLPRLPETVFYILACARLGISYSVAHPTASPQELNRYIDRHKPKLIVTSNHPSREERRATVDSSSRRGGEGEGCSGVLLPCKEKVDKLLEWSSVPHVVVVERWKEKGETMMTGNRDYWHHELLNKREGDVVAPVVVPADSPLFYTFSSSSHAPHSVVGYLMHLKMTLQMEYNFTHEDRFWCVADVSETNGHSYGVYGPLLAGASFVLYEANVCRPPTSRVWETVDELSVSILLAHASTFDTWMMDHREHDRLSTSKRDSLRVLGSVGLDPVSPQCWRFLQSEVGSNRCMITEIDNLSNSLRAELPYLLPKRERERDSKDFAEYMEKSCSPVTSFDKLGGALKS